MNLLCYDLQYSHPWPTNTHQSIQFLRSCNRLGVARTQTDHNLKEVQQRQQVALDFVVPDFISPFPFMMNPGVEEANKAACKWAVHHCESVMSPEKFQALVYQAEVHDMAGGAYPDAPISQLEFAIEFITWVYILDDITHPQKCSLEQLVQMHIDIQAVIVSAFPQDNNLRDNLIKHVNNALGRFEFAEDFVEKVVAQATMKHLLGAGMQTLATYAYNIFASS